MRPLLLCLCLGLLSTAAACGDDDDDTGVTADAGGGPDGEATIDAAAADARADATPLPPPEATWKEHWFEHDQELELVDYNNDVAIYFDPDVNRDGTGWILPFMTDLWRYSEATYGDIGEGRLFAVFHEGKYSGGHPSTSYDDSHDLRNVTDCGPGPWQSGYDIPSHEAGHIVESANNGMHGSPAFGVWHDSKWMEFYQYDAYVALGMDAEAQRVFDKFSATEDDFPRAGTHWFRDWFYPLWRDHGHAQVMVRFFRLLSEHYPKNGHEYTRGLNLGEFVHFMSGAAETNLKQLATDAFGWTQETDSQFQAARTEFAAITY
jgi:hypothetical protein